MAGQHSTGNDFPQILFRFPLMIRLDCLWEHRGVSATKKIFQFFDGNFGLIYMFAYGAFHYQEK